MVGSEEFVEAFDLKVNLQHRIASTNAASRHLGEMRQELESILKAPAVRDPREQILSPTGGANE
jgi:hypothetical protein